MEEGQRLSLALARRDLDVLPKDAQGRLPVGAQGRLPGDRGGDPRGRAQSNDGARSPSFRPYRMNSRSQWDLRLQT